MKSAIRKILIGNATISEYSTIMVPGEVQEKVWLEIAGTLTDISQDHWLLCIEPVIFGVWIPCSKTNSQPQKQATYRIYFSDSANTGNIQKHAVAAGSLTFMESIEEQDGLLLLLKLESSSLYQINFLKAYILFSRYYKKNGLTFSRFNAFVAAYSYPRRIRIVSFRQNDYYNIFPMDLLGDLTQPNRYVFGLRHTNVALARILETGKLVVSEIPFGYKQLIYQLGKHHSSSVPSLESLPFTVIKSKLFGFPVPSWAASYKEITLLKTINLGSHMLLWGEPIARDELSKPVDPLFLIHFIHYLHQKRKGTGYRLV